VAKAAFVVSNTTPLINLAGVGLLELLPDRYGAVTVAELVLTEYEAKASLTEPQTCDRWSGSPSSLSPFPTI
jgi:predicted nucleic acid-binding protein